MMTAVAAKHTPGSRGPDRSTQRAGQSSASIERVPRTRHDGCTPFETLLWCPRAAARSGIDRLIRASCRSCHRQPSASTSIGPPAARGDSMRRSLAPMAALGAAVALVTAIGGSALGQSPSAPASTAPVASPAGLGSPAAGVLAAPVAIGPITWDDGRRQQGVQQGPGGLRRRATARRTARGRRQRGRGPLDRQGRGLGVV